MALSKEQLLKYNKIVSAVSKIVKGARFNHFGLKDDSIQVNAMVSKYTAPDQKKQIADVFKKEGFTKLKIVVQAGVGSPLMFQGQYK